MVKALRIPVSFKQEEQDLYNFAKSKRNASCYIKDLIARDMKSNRTNVNNVVNINEDNDLGFNF